MLECEIEGGNFYDISEGITRSEAIIQVTKIVEYLHKKKYVWLGCHPNNIGELNFKISVPPGGACVGDSPLRR